MIVEGFTPTQGRIPLTGEQQLRVQFREGSVSKWTYTAKQLRWDDTGHAFDITGVQRV